MPSRRWSSVRRSRRDTCICDTPMRSAISVSSQALGEPQLESFRSRADAAPTPVAAWTSTRSSRSLPHRHPACPPSCPLRRSRTCARPGMPGVRRRVPRSPPAPAPRRSRDGAGSHARMVSGPPHAGARRSRGRRAAPPPASREARARPSCGRGSDASAPRRWSGRRRSKMRSPRGVEAIDGLDEAKRRDLHQVVEGLA